MSGSTTHPDLGGTGYVWQALKGGREFVGSEEENRENFSSTPITASLGVGIIILLGMIITGCTGYSVMPWWVAPGERLACIPRRLCGLILCMAWTTPRRAVTGIGSPIILPSSSTSGVQETASPQCAAYAEYAAYPGSRRVREGREGGCNCRCGYQSGQMPQSSKYLDYLFQGTNFALIFANLVFLYFYFWTVIALNKWFTLTPRHMHQH